MKKRIYTQIEVDKYYQFKEICKKKNIKVSQVLRNVINRYLNYENSKGEKNAN